MPSKIDKQLCRHRPQRSKNPYSFQLSGEIDQLLKMYGNRATIYLGTTFCALRRRESGDASCFPTVSCSVDSMAQMADFVCLSENQHGDMLHRLVRHLAQGHRPLLRVVAYVCQV